MKSLILSALFLSVFAAHAATPVVCTTNKIYVGAAGQTEAKAQLSFVKSADAVGYPALRNFKGSLVFPDYLITKLGDADPSDLINVRYNIAEVKSNPNYRPTKYKDSVQFKGIEATKEAPGSASGNLYSIDLIIPKTALKTSGAFKAVVQVNIDQNGARMILDCK